uniref:Uncharacterized protein n=1 Tax=Romanomermis culicivorax TaxID=13658 RepID=A0A915HTR3_ROMCU
MNKRIYVLHIQNTPESVAWARTNKNGQWEIEKDFTGSGYSFHNFLYINFGKTECLRAGQRVIPMRSEK